VGAALALALAVGCTSAPAREPDAPSPTGGASSPSPGISLSPSVSPGLTEAEPQRTRFAGRIVPIPATLAARMRGATWRRGCPVPISGLRLLRFNYVDLDGVIERGPMVVNATVAEDVLWVFGQLFHARFPIQQVGLAREFDEAAYEEHPNSRRGVTASFNCRVVITPDGPGDTFSQHSYGLAVDVNPLQNPFVGTDGYVHNRFARPFVDRSGDSPGMIHDGDVVVDAFAAIGWSWGGRWSGDKDYMHFSASGR
jgi:hypothetical protein